MWAAPRASAKNKPTAKAGGRGGVGRGARTRQQSEEKSERPVRFSASGQGSTAPHAVVAVGAPLVGKRGFRPAVIPEIHRVPRGGELGVRPVVVQRLETARLAHPGRRWLRHLRRGVEVGRESGKGRSWK